MTDRKRAPLAAAAAACAGILYLALAVGQTASAVTADVSVSFLSTGGEQTFVVPTGVRQISVVANGGKGGNGGRATNNGGFRGDCLGRRPCDSRSDALRGGRGQR